jgi:ABC-type multidrug transport system ATPase subunit
MPEEIVLQSSGLRLQNGAHPAGGTFEFILRQGQGGLVILDNLDLLRRLMRCCLGIEQSKAGRISWWEGSREVSRSGSWGQYKFYRCISYVNRHSQLLGSLTLNQNFQILHDYTGRENGPERTRRTLADFGLAEYGNKLADSLPEPVRRLALYALALAREPYLILMERPSQFLDRDFDLVWARLRTQASEEQLAYIVFDRTPLPYDPAHFQWRL